MQNTTTNPAEERAASDEETFLAPAPPSKGKIIAVDCHPDTFTAAVVQGTTPHDARKLQTKADISLQLLLDWSAENFTASDIFLLEAGGNSFEVQRRLNALGLRCYVLESQHVGKHAKIYADNDKIAAMRIAMVYLGTKTPCVWAPDAKTCERREILHSYQRAVTRTTQVTNALKGYLNQYALRPGKKNLKQSSTHQWILSQRDWTPIQKLLLENHFNNIVTAFAERQRLERIIGAEITSTPSMLSLMSLLGIGPINAFAVVAVLGDIKRFASPRKLAAYLGLNPGSRESGNIKNIKVGVGRRGRRDLRSLLIQAAHAVLRKGGDTAIGRWGMALFFRKGHRNVAVAAIARKLSAQIWHLLNGNKPEWLEQSKSRDIKLTKLISTIGKKLRSELQLGSSIAETVANLNTIINKHQTGLLKT